MTLFEVVLKVTHDCPFANVSRKYLSMKLFQWCNREREVMEVVVDKPEEYDEVREQLSQMGEIFEESSDSQRVHLITTPCFCDLEGSVASHIDSFDILQVDPVVYNEGWEYHRLIVFRHKDLQKLMERLEKNGFIFDIVRKVPFDGFIASSLTLTADALFSSLTEKQMDALLTAYRHGYYQLPRKTDVQKIASRRRVPRTTFQEHLQKAESKLVVSLVPYMQLFKQASPERRERLKLK